MSSNDGGQFARLPATEAEREVDGRASRDAVVDFWSDRYGVPRETFDGYTFWEKGAGKLWAFRAEVPSPAAHPVEGLGMTFLRTRQEHWKPTTTAVQRFGREATRNVLDLNPEQARRFAAGEDQALPEWDGDWGYLIVAHELAGEREPVGVGLYLHDELRSQVPKGRRRNG